jgi:NADPH-dependent curcumin reductase CurA
MFCRMRGGKSYLQPFELGQPLEGGAVGTVVKSGSSAFKPGDVVISNFGWREAFVAESDTIRLATNGEHTLSSYLGVLGLQRICSWASAYLVHVKQGGALLVYGAAAVAGSMASQLANLRGCHIIGSAGSRDMVSFLRDECGFDIAFDYKSGPILTQLAQAPSPCEGEDNAALDAALGVCMAGSFLAKATPGVAGNAANLPLPIYFLSQSDTQAI